MATFLLEGDCVILVLEWLIESHAGLKVIWKKYELEAECVVTRIWNNLCLVSDGKASHTQPLLGTASPPSKERVSLARPLPGGSTRHDNAILRCCLGITTHVFLLMSKTQDKVFGWTRNQQGDSNFDPVHCTCRGFFFFTFFMFLLSSFSVCFSFVFKRKMTSMGDAQKKK